ncbi:hypothetical protein U1Q18_033523 [Sarracenia purpurea var. burkii]
MEERSNRCVPELLPFGNKPPMSPKPFTTTTTHPMATASYEGWHQPYFINYHGGVLPPSVEVPNQKTPIPATAGSCEGWQQQPYFISYGGDDGNGGATTHLEPFDAMTSRPPPSGEVSNKELLIPTPLSRNPITFVTPSSVHNGGITVKTELGIDYELKRGRKMDLNMDAKKLRRILSNRISAQKSRLRKVQYVSDMEKKKKELEAEVAVLTPLVENEQEQQKRLKMENLILKEKMRAVEHRASLSLAVVKENQAVIKRMKELHGFQLKFRMQEMPLTLGLNSIGRINNDQEQTTACSPSSREAGVLMPPLEADQGELDPALNFRSLAIHPPNSLI